MNRTPSITVAPHSAPTRKSRRKATPMDDDGKTVEVFLPCTLTARDVGHHARSTIRMIATEAGDFVGDIKIGPGIHQGDGWCRWTARYRPAPPGVFVRPGARMKSRRPKPRSASRRASAPCPCLGGHVSASTTPPPPCALIPTPARLWLRKVMSITLSMARTGTRRLKECRCEPVCSSAREAR